MSGALPQQEAEAYSSEVRHGAIGDQENDAATALQSRVRGRQASFRVSAMREQIEVDVLKAEAEVERGQAARERRRTRESEASMVKYEMEQILPALDNQLQQQELVMQQQLLMQQQVCACVVSQSHLNSKVA